MADAQQLTPTTMPAPAQATLPAPPVAPTTLPTPNDDLEHPEKPKNPKQNICKKFWWLFLLLGLLPLLIILPLLLWTYPNALSRAVQSSSFNVTFMSILDPTPESLELTVVERLWTMSSHHATIHPHDQYLYNTVESPPFAVVPSRKTKAGNNSTMQAGPRRMNVTNIEELTKFIRSFAMNEDLRFFMGGFAKVQKGGLPKHKFPYIRPVVMKGLNGLRSFEVTEFNLQQNMLDAEHVPIHNARGVIYLLNPSVVLIEMGNVTMTLSVDDTKIGTATIPNFRLQPGHNRHQIYANLDKAAVAAMVKAKQQNTLPVDFRGMKSTFHGRPIPYFKDVLQTRHKKVQLHIPDGMI